MAKFLNRFTAFNYPLPLVRPESFVEVTGTEAYLWSPDPDDSERVQMVIFGDETDVVNALKEGGEVEKNGNTWRITEPFGG